MNCPWTNRPVTVTDTYYMHSGASLRTSFSCTTRYHSDTMYEGVSGDVLIWAFMVPRDASLFVRLIIVVYFYFLFWLITDDVYYLSIVIILFRNFYSEYYINFHARSHLFLCVSLPNMYIFFWTIFDFFFHFSDYFYSRILLFTFFPA